MQQSIDLNLTSETKSCWCRAAVEPALCGSSTTFETSLTDTGIVYVHGLQTITITN